MNYNRGCVFFCGGFGWCFACITRLLVYLGVDSFFFFFFCRSGHTLFPYHGLINVFLLWYNVLRFCLGNGNSSFSGTYVAESLGCYRQVRRPIRSGPA